MNNINYLQNFKEGVIGASLRLLYLSSPNLKRRGHRGAQLPIQIPTPILPLFLKHS